MKIRPNQGFEQFHNQTLLNKNAKYLLRNNSDSQPLFVEITHPSDSAIRCTNDPLKAKRFHGTYLLSTVWEWELGFIAIHETPSTP